MKNDKLNITNSEVSNILFNELQVRKESNPNYSLRAFAKALNISPSFLSKLLNQQKNISKDRFSEMISKLNLPSEKQAMLMKRVKIEATNSTNSDAHFNKLFIDQFQFISDWYHYAIMEFISINKLNDTLEMENLISKEFGISLLQVKKSLSILKRLNLIQYNLRTKKWILVSTNTTTMNTNFKSDVANKIHEKQILEKAKESIDQVPFELRSQSSMTLAIPKKQINKAKEMIIKFQRQLMSELQCEKNNDSVYQLSISFFPLTESAKSHNFDPSNHAKISKSKIYNKNKVIKTNKPIKKGVKNENH